jgi:hypothetical protein
MKAICPILVVISCLFYTSCRQDKKDLIYTVSDFSVPISCISSSHSDTVFYIGEETGDVVKINIINNSRTVIPVANNRVYDIYEEEEDTLWVAIRDEGLEKIVNQKVDTQRFHIHKFDSTGRETTEKTTNYGIYDIEKDTITGNLYFAASSGLYWLKPDERNNDTLSLFFRPDSLRSTHFGINKIHITENFIYCATDSGLIILDKNKECLSQRDNQPLIKGNSYYLFASKNDSMLYVSFDKGYYRVNMNNHNDTRFIPEDNHFAHIFDPDPEGEWELTSTRMKYSNNRGFYDLPTRLSRSYKNYIHLGRNFVLLACGNRLFSFSRHQHKGDINSVIAAATDINGNICYFITNANQLYKYEYKKEKESNPQFIGETKINKGENIVKMCSSEKNIWLITDNRLYKIDKGGGTTVIVGETDKKIDFRSILYHKKKLFIGSRYFLYRIDDPDSTKTITLDTIDVKGGMAKNDLYITDIRFNQADKRMYFSSLNKGVFYLDNINDKELIQIPKSDTIGNIRKIINNNLLLTSKGIYHISDQSDQISKIYPIESILYSIYGSVEKDDNILYTVGYSGIGCYKITDSKHINKSESKSLSHFDITFNQAAIVPIQEGLVLGSQSGLFVYHSDGGMLKTVDIPKEPTNWCLIGVIVLIVILFIAIACIFVLYNNTEKRLKDISNAIQKCNEKKSTIKKEKEEELNLSDKLKEIENNYDKIYKQEIDKKILKLKNNRRIIQNIEAQFKNLGADIDNNQIKRENIIDQYNEHIIALKQEIEKYRDYNNSREKLEDIKRSFTVSKSISSYNEILKELIEMTKDLFNQFAKYLPQNEFPNEIINELKDIINAGDKEKIKANSIRFFNNHKEYFYEIETHWSTNKKVVACIYLAHEKKILPQDILDIYNDIDGKTVSDIRREIHSELNNVKNKNVTLNIILKKLLDKTIPNRK